MNEFEKIYLTYFNDVYKFVLSMSKNNSVAEDIVQETFFKALKNINKLSNECSVKSWLFQIAKNTYFTYISKNNKNIALDSINDVATDTNIEKEFLNKEISKKIHKIVHKLKEPYKEIFYLRVFSGLSFKEIADIFDKEENWARQTFHRSKIMIKEEIE